MSMSRESEALRANLRQWIADGDIGQVAEEADLTRETLSRYLHGHEENPGLQTLERLAAVLHKTVIEMLTPVSTYTEGTNQIEPFAVREAEPLHETLSQLEIGAVRRHLVSARDGQTKIITIFGQAYVPIPHLLDPVAAGLPIPSEGFVDAMFLTPLEIVRRWVRGPIPFGRVLSLDVDGKKWLGDSMSPTIKPGAQLVVDMGPGLAGPTAFEDGSIYIVRTDDGLTCKRVWRTDDTLNCHADNRHVAPLVLHLDRRRGLRAHILGEVVRISNPVD